MPDFGLEIIQRADLATIVARWQREINPAELQSGYEAILTAADACGYWRWLLDLRRRDELATPDVDQWMERVFLPQLARRYEQPVRMALLVSPRRALHRRNPAPDATKQLAPADQAQHHASFTDEAAACRWLEQE